MNQKFILFILFFSLIVSVTSTSVFAEIEFESGPLHDKPLDEREHEDKFTEEVLIYAIILVIIFIIIRLLLRVMKNRMKPKKD
jgi:formate hydrogenlyase subunit 3/multisubunit Na+/H+ antiporter MnhD subunit